MTEQFAAVVLTLAFTILFSVGVIAARLLDKRTWNNGVCALNGLPWKHFDTDSQGGRGYRAGDEYCWISYGVDK